MHPGFIKSGLPQRCTGKMPVPPFDKGQIMEAIASGDQSPLEISRRAGMSILELAQHICTPRNLESLGRVAQLHAIEREILLGQLKRDALMRLRELTDEVPAASGDEVRACEVMRKACADILRFGHGPASLPHSTPPPRDDTPEPLNEEKILEALERLGREENQYEPYEPRAQASGSSLLSQTSGSVAPSPSDTRLESCLPNDSRSRIGPCVSGGCASGSLRKCTGKMPVPLLKDADNRTGGAPGLRATCRGIEDGNSTSASQTRFDDAHPP